MTRIVIDPATKARLEGLSEVVELCDESGRLLGEFVPKLDSFKWEPVGPELSDEELERRANSSARRYTTDEVLDHLRNL